MPLNAYTNACYFTLRSGGKTLMTFLFDSGFTWVICVPLAMMLIYWTDMEVVGVYILVQMSDLIKCAMGYVMLRKGVWINNIVR